MFGLPILYGLGDLPIIIWDESRLAINALEMYENNNWLATTFDSLPDFWNTKPPLMVWLQVLSLHVFGKSEFALRFPSAMAAFFTCLAVYYFISDVYKSKLKGVFAALILLTASGFVNIHSARTGDYDSLLCLFTTLYSFLFFKYILSGRNKYLTLSVLCVVLAVFTKGIAGLFLLPGLAIFAILQGEWPKLIYNKWLYICGGLAILSIVAYYLARDLENPGYLRAVFENEIGGRFGAAIEENQHPFYFYFVNFLFFGHFSFLIYLAPLGVFFGWKSKIPTHRLLTFFTLSISVTFLVIISLAATKLSWYDLPMFPLIAVLVFIGLDGLVDLLAVRFKILPKFQFALLFVFIFLPYLNLLRVVTGKDQSFWNREFYGLSLYLKDHLDQLNNVKVVYDEYDAHLKVYHKIYPQKVLLIKSEGISPEDVVLIQNNSLDQIKTLGIEVLDQNDLVSLVKVKPYLASQGPPKK